MADNFALQLQKLANSTQLKLQELSNEATAKTLSYNTKEAAKTREYNTAEATSSRKWQEKMSNTAHQREVKDLKKAGLNPVLAANQGAQSYTTSSASAQNASGQAENPSNAIASITGAQMAGMSNIHSSQISAAATKQAAAAAAAAQRYAAAQSAAAQIYAANKNYETQQMAWEKKKEIQESINRTQLQIIDKTPPKNLPELAWKIADQTGLRSTLTKNKMTHVITNGLGTLLNNPKQYFQNVKDTAVSVRNFKLNYDGRRLVGNALKNLNVVNTSYSRSLLVKAVVFRQPFAISAIARLIRNGYRMYDSTWYGNHM